MPARIVANLDCECDFARLAARLRGDSSLPAPDPGDPRFGLPEGLARSLSALGTLCRAFAAEGDRIWTRYPVERRRMAEAPGIPTPHLETGPLLALDPLGELIAWAETEEVAAARSHVSTGAETGVEEPHACRFCAILRIPRATTPLAAARANHKGLALDAARAGGCALPEARLLRELREIDEHLENGAGRASPGRRWVLKAPHSAGGRLRVRGAGDALLGPQRTAAARLLELHGELVFEPWMDRVDDLGAVFEVTGDGVAVHGRHRIVGTRGGVFRGIRIPGMTPPVDADRLPEAAVEAAGRRLVEAGFEGVFGIDAWTYRTAAGELALNPIGEINARLTFGAVAAALAERLRRAGAIPARSDVVLRVGKTLPAGGDGMIPLLLPGGGDPTAAWVEIDPSDA